MLIINCGCQAPIGTKAGIVSTSYRAGFAGIRLHDDYEDRDFNPVRVGLAEYINPYLDIEKQLIKLSVPAMKEALTLSQDKKPVTGKIPAIIGLPEDRPGIPPELTDRLREALTTAAKKMGIELQISFIKSGHTACLEAMEQAKDQLSETGLVLVGGVDSYNHLETFHWLEKDKNRLFCSYNNDGFIPGQGAGFVLLASNESAGAFGLDPFGEVLSVAKETEENSFDSGKNSTGMGATRCVRKNLETVSGEDNIDEIFSAINGEAYNAVEHAYTMINIGDRVNDPRPPIAPYTSCGDMGAATIPILMGFFSFMVRKNYINGPLNLFMASNLGDRRASALIKANMEYGANS